MSQLFVSDYVKKTYISTLHMICAGGEWYVRVWLDDDLVEDICIKPPLLVEQGVAFLDLPTVMLTNVTGKVSMSIMQDDVDILNLGNGTSVVAGDFTCSFEPLSLVAPG